MAKKKKALPSGTTDALNEPVKNWADKRESAAWMAASKLYPKIVKSFQNKEDQEDRIEELWNIYTCTTDTNQAYVGMSMDYIPACRDCVNARSKRAVKQLFPVNNKHVDGISSDGHTPYTQLSLLEHYIRKTDLRTIVRSDLVAGDVTGQWNLMVDWTRSTRNVTKLVKRNPVLADGDDDLEAVDPMADEEEKTEEEEVIEQGPEVVDFATQDLSVLPPTCTNLQKAKAVTIRLRMSADKVQQMVDEGVFILPPDTEIEAFCEPDKAKDKKNPAKKATQDAGIRTEGTYKYALIFMTYTKLDLGGEYDEEAIVFYAGQDEIVGLIKNPLWSGRRPVLSAPIDRLQGSFFGQSKLEAVKYLQWGLNDFWNQGKDSATYSLIPIWAADPLTVPNWATLTMGPGAVWAAHPNSIAPLTQPQLWKDAAAYCGEIKKQIWESMDVNGMMMGQMPQGRKNNQMMGAMQQEQSINIIDHATRYEEVMLNPLMEMLFEFDQQFRDAELEIETRGEIGYKAKIEQIPVQQWGERYFFRWTGTDYMLGMQRMQQQIAWMNVLKGIPPQQLNGLTFDATPILLLGTENIFGPEMAPKILIDKRNQFTVPAEVENQMIANGLPAETHESDNDQEHLQIHMRGAGIDGDLQGLYKMHMQGHMIQIQRKRQMQMAQQGGVPGGPGGGPGTAAPPGVAGAPRPGAIPGQPRGGQQPPGAVHADQMSDGAMPGRG